MRHRFHALCPYFAMFPESFAEHWIKKLTRPGDLVLDPFSGRGTTAFSALLLGRSAIACDVNDVAYCLTKAKTSAPQLPVLRRRITELEHGFRARNWKKKAKQYPEFFHVAYSECTLQQLLYLRESLFWRTARTDTMIAALVLGSLHGEMDKSSSYLSNQMPRTISTKPAYSLRFWKIRGLEPPDRNIFSLLRRRATFRYETLPPSGKAFVFNRDMRELPWIADSLPKPLCCVITSPPYLDVTNYEEDQWLRLWFLGGPPYPTHGRLSRDDRYSTQDKYWRFIADMWRALSLVLAKNAHIVIRLGSRHTQPNDLVRMLKASSQFAQRSVKLVSTTVSELKNRQTNAFQPGTKGCRVEVDCHFQLKE